MRWQLPMPAPGWMRPAAIVAFLLVLLGLSRLAESLVLGHDFDNIAGVQQARSTDYLETAEREFAGVQRSTRRIATEIAGNDVVVRALNGADTARAGLFETVSRMAREQDVGIEVYDRQGRLLAWEGRSGAPHRREVRIALDGQMTSYVNRTPIASQLFVAIPVREHGRITGAVIVLRTIDVNFPLNNRYIRREGLTNELTRRLGVTVEFNFAPGAEPRKDGRYASAVLYGIDSTRVGTVSIMRPPRTSVLLGAAAPFRTFDSILLLALLATVVTVLWRAAMRRLRSPLGRFGAAAVLIVAARYAALWIDIGALAPSFSLFDPGLFASQLGGGIARSAGELTISVAALVWLVVTGLLTLSGRRGGPPPAPRYPQHRPLGWAVAAVTALLLFWLLYGLTILTHSAVFDSTIRFSDPREITPSFELAVMILDLLLAAACVLTIAGVAVRFMLKCFAGGKRPKRLEWIATLMLLLAAAALSGLLPQGPAAPAGVRLEFALLALVVGARLADLTIHPLRVTDVRTGVLLLCSAAALYYPLIDMNVRAKDRDRVETFADEVTRPVDSWMTSVVEDALQGFTTDETIDVLMDHDGEEIQRLPFNRWGRSLACREGYASLFALTDSLGREMSRFAIGGQVPALMRLDTVKAVPPEKSIGVQEVGTGISAIRVYFGSTPVRGYDGKVHGFGRVFIATGQQALFRGENPALLRSAGPENLRSFYRPVSVSEFLDGVVLATTNPGVPVGYRLPQAAAGALDKAPAGGVWIRETIAGQTYETYYLRKPGDPGSVVALGLQEPGLVWHLIALVKLLSFCVVVALVLVVLAVAVRWARGGPILASFRDRLLLALLVTSLVPLALMAIYGRVAARDRLMSNTANRLAEYTLSVAQNIPDQPDSLRRIPLSGAEDLATDMGTDFNVYLGPQLVLTSRPELFEAGILDRRMSGRAYSTVLLGGERFFVETERIGAFDYAVGYRAVVGDDGKITAVVSVPTLFRQDEIDAEVSRRNAFLLGVYLVVLLAMVGFATAFASRIAAPIHRLTEATRRVAQGELSVRLDDLRAEGEIGELIRSFEQMTTDLQRSRETLLRAERELAWKEMAREVAHEIKNPLTPMRLAVQHLRMVFHEGAADFDKILDEVTRTVLNQIETLSRIASEFSHFARMPRAQLAECDLNQVVRESVELFDRVDGVRFHLDAAPGLPVILADKDELRRAFINILRNAIQAMTTGGDISVSTRPAGTGAEVTIHDTGPGIPEEIRKRLFQQNLSTKPEGMGLGLALVKKTIEELGGSIRIESEMSQGTSVIIQLPPAAGRETGALTGGTL